MSIGGGEILRAVLSDPANVVDYQPAFYVMTLESVNGTADARATTRGFLQLKQTHYFLMTGIVPTATNVGGAGTGFFRGSAPEFFRIYDPSTANAFVFEPSLQTNLMSETSLNWSVTLPEYILWEPSSLIGAEWNGANFADTIDFKFLSLVGIEFGMR